MYYRRKIILGLLETFDGRLKKTDFQKLLFILSRHQKKPSYEFIPYKYGCFSFQSYADLRTMIKYDLVSEDVKDNANNSGYWIKKDKDNYVGLLNKTDHQLVRYIKSKFIDYSTEDLIYYTYKKYPYFAINSTIAENILSADEYEKVKAAKPFNTDKALYTIGYEGISQEEYLNRLIQNDVKVLCDVRRNSKSMKFGFSKSQLKTACESLNIEYTHIPELGIKSSKRKSLNSQCDYDALFSDYRETLKYNTKVKAINQILELLKKNDRIAITCFEANIHQCHRKHLANRVYYENNNYQVIHI